MPVTTVYLHSSESKGSGNVLGHSEWHPLWHTEAPPLLKAHVVVHVYNLCVCVGMGVK